MLNSKGFRALIKNVNNSPIMLKNTITYLLLQKNSMSNLAIPFLKNVLEHNQESKILL